MARKHKSKEHKQEINLEQSQENQEKKSLTEEQKETIEQPITEEQEANEETLEQEVEDEEESYFDEYAFSNFISNTKRIAPTLQETEIQIPETENIEDITQTSPTTSASEQEQFNYTINDPNYSAGNYEQTRQEQERGEITSSTRIISSPDEMTRTFEEIRPRQQQTAWGSELQQAERETSKYEQTIQPELESEERKLPFERRKLRERRL